MHNTTKELALSSLMSATGVVFLLLGGILPFATFISPLLSAITIIIVYGLCEKKYVWCSYVSICVLGLLLCNDKEAVCTFVFFGYYPIIRDLFEKVGSKTVRIILKGCYFLLAIAADYSLLIFVFQLQEVIAEMEKQTPWMLGLMVAMGIAIFFIFDIFCSRYHAMLLKRRMR